MARERVGFARDWRLIALLALTAFAVLRLGVFVARAAVTPTHGFVSYYTAARLLLEGQPLARAYDDAWFQAQIARFEPRANDIFRPNPPAAALLALPVAWLDHDEARIVWLALNALLLLGAGTLLLRALAWPARWQLAFWAVALSFQPVWANFAFGQAYLGVLLLTVCAWVAFQRARPGALGAALGGLLALKLAGLLYWPLLALRRQWRALAAAVGVAAGVVVLTLPLTGGPAWLALLPVLARVRTDPSQTVTAFQTLPSWARHLFLYEAQWNPTPLLNAPAAALLLSLLAGAALLAASLYAAHVAAAGAQPPRLAFAAFSLLGLVISPFSIDYHYALALLPLALLADWLRTQPRRRWQWPWLVFALGLAAIGLPLPYQSPRLDAGAWALLAYPKLYGALLLWALALWAQLGTAPAPLAWARRAWARARPYAARGTALALVAGFWALGLWRLDQFPPVHYDEPSILAPGYKLFTQGVYGADMFTGFFGQEQHYLEVPPLMSLLQGALARLIGVGVWPARYLPGALGALVLALTFALGRRLAGPAVGAAAAALALLWQWTPSGLEFLGSGLPLLDVARLARYDILVPVCGLAALLVWLPSQRTQVGGRWLFLAGLLAGLAALANVIGLFWIAVLGLAELLARRGWRSLAALALGAALPLAAWGAVLLANWGDFLGQARKHIGRYEFTDPAFYLASLRAEVHRYYLGVSQPATFTRLGFYLVIIGVPLALGWLAWRAGRQGDRRARWLLLPALIWPALLAVFEALKRFYYLVNVLPLWAVALAWLAVVLWRRAPRGGRAVLALAGVVLAAQAAGGVAVQHTLAAARPAPAVFFSELRAALPPVSGNVLGPPQYWLGLPEPRFRSIGLPFLQAGPLGLAPIAFRAALEQAAPAIVLLHPSLTDSLASADALEPVTPTRAAQFAEFMAAHQARQVAELTDYDGLLVRVFVLQW